MEHFDSSVYKICSRELHHFIPTNMLGEQKYKSTPEIHDGGFEAYIKVIIITYPSLQITLFLDIFFLWYFN